MVNKIRLKGRSSKILTQIASPKDKKNDNESRRPSVARKKTAPKQEDKVIEAPVKVRVFRTVKKRTRDDEGNLVTEEAAHGDDLTPSQADAEQGELLDEQTIEIRKFVTEPARVRFNFQLSPTVHYQGASAGCSVEIPCYVEEIRDAAVEAEEICLDIMRPKTKELKSVTDYLIKQKIAKETELRNKGII